MTEFGQIVLAWHLILAIAGSLAPAGGEAPARPYRVLRARLSARQFTATPRPA